MVGYIGESSMSHAAHLNLRIFLVCATLIGCLYLWGQPKAMDVTLRISMPPKASP